MTNSEVVPTMLIDCELMGTDRLMRPRCRAMFPRRMPTRVQAWRAERGRCQSSITTFSGRSRCQRSTHGCCRIAEGPRPSGSSADRASPAWGESLSGSARPSLIAALARRLESVTPHGRSRDRTRGRHGFSSCLDFECHVASETLHETRRQRRQAVVPS